MTDKQKVNFRQSCNGPICIFHHLFNLMLILFNFNALPIFVTRAYIISCRMGREDKFIILHAKCAIIVTCLIFCYRHLCKTQFINL